MCKTPLAPRAADYLPPGIADYLTHAARLPVLAYLGCMARLILMLAGAAVAVALVIFFVLSVIHILFVVGLLLLVVMLGFGAFRVGRWSRRGSRQGS